VKSLATYVSHDSRARVQATCCRASSRLNHSWIFFQLANVTVTTLRQDAEQQQRLIVLLHAVPPDFIHDRLPQPAVTASANRPETHA
jgi:hypothetical protein